MTNQTDRWPVWANRVNQHLVDALNRSVDHGVPVEKASFLGLIFFAGASASSFDEETTVEEIAMLRTALNYALDQMAEAAVARQVKG